MLVNCKMLEPGEGYDTPCTPCLPQSGICFSKAASTVKRYRQNGHGKILCLPLVEVHNRVPKSRIRTYWRLSPTSSSTSSLLSSNNWTTYFRSLCIEAYRGV